MIGKARWKSRAQAQTEPEYSQSNWGGGENLDLPGSKIARNELALLTNAVDYKDYIEGHSGSLRLASTALPGSGTVYDLQFHPTAKKWLLVRGSQVWVAGATVASWTEIKTTAPEGLAVPVIAGDTGSQFSTQAVLIRGVNSSNSNAGVLYWDLTNSAGTRTFSLYKTLTLGVKSNLVARGTSTGTNANILVQQNASGINGAITSIAYTGDDTDAANTFTCAIEESVYSGGVARQVRIVKYKNDFLILSGLYPSFQRGNAYIDLTNSKAYMLGSAAGVGYSSYLFAGSGSEDVATPYGRRYLLTFSRIVNSAGTPDATKNRVTGTLVFEGPSNAAVTVSNGDSIDYGEYWTADPVASGTPISVDLKYSSAYPLAIGAGSHYTHVSLYATLNIGVDGTDPSTGLGNNRELYTWVADIDIGSSTYSDTITDDILRSRFKAGFGLRTRFWKQLPGGECGCIVNDFLFQAGRGDSKVYYQQLLKPEHMGFYRPDSQFMTFMDGVQFLSESDDQLAVICSSETWKVNPKVIKNVDPISSVFTIGSRFPASHTIGLTDWGSFQLIETGGFIARCNDGSIRIWNGDSWGADLGDKRVHKTLVNMVDGSASGYYKGAYYLWYRTASGDANNTKCLRLGLGGDAGFGWSNCTRTAWLFPYLRVGAAIMMDSNNLARLMVLDYTTGNLYWIETFTNANASLTKAWKDQENVSSGTDIVATIRFREYTGSKEHHTLYHEESHAYFRPSIPADGYLTGFQVGLNAYVDGSSTAAASASNAPRDGDIQLSKVASGRRLQLEITTTTSKFQLTGIDSDIQEQDKATIGSQFSDTDEATYQTELASNLKHMLCRPKALKNRANGLNYTLGGTAPTAVTGPDGKTYALSFPTGASYTQADTQSYAIFSVGFWCKTVTLSKKIFIIDGPTTDFYVQFTSNTVMDINGEGTITVSTIASGWHNFWIVRSGTVLGLYQNGAFVGQIAIASTAKGGTQLQINPSGGAMILDVIQVHTAFLSAGAIALHYDDIVNSNGKRLLPLG